MGDTGVAIRPARRSDVVALSALLARAFHDDPPFVWMLPDPASRPRRLRRFFTTLLRWDALRFGGVEVACEPDRISGVALWLPPDHWLAPLGRQLLTLPGYARAYGRRLGQASTLLRAGAAVHPREPHWYLGVVGVDPQRQGHGVGGVLLRSRLDRCDWDGTPAYLESSKTSNVPLYEHLGFRATGVLALPEGARVITTMWRPARSPHLGTAATDPG
ncbi:MAG TPA: GNAT family N-acetyltransferase [Mycobacteriales bacterium]|nr:GNAT family N-acetyltransferase [Mycobacteriales bacterium]